MSNFGQVRMSFCPACGRPRTAGSRFCVGCGHEFRAPAPEALAAENPGEGTRLDLPLDATRWEAPADATRLEPAADPTRWEAPADATRLEPAADPFRWEAPADATRLESVEPDPFAAWFVPEAPAPTAGRPASPPTGPADSWQTADTVYATPSPAYRPPGPSGPGYPPAGSGYPPPAGSGYPPPAESGYPPPGRGYSPPPGPVYGEPGRRPSRGGRAALIIVAVLVVLAAGGGAYAFISRSRPPAAAGPPATATATGTPSAQSSTSASASGSPSASPSASATASASPSPSLVAVAPSVGSNPATPQVETVLSHFFGGINSHSYPEYTSALDPQERASQTQSSFNSGYSTTTDSGMTLTSLTSTSGGGLAATVTFTSHQAASSSVDNSTCNHWTLTFYLEPHGTGYLDGAAPSGYQPKYSNC